eukprot:COSAG02_NODE_5171_length_4573_cov_4.774475_5_plen_75_part_00
MIVSHQVRGGVKYHCNRFPDRHRLCDAQPMEWLEFGAVDTLGTEQTRTLQFREAEPAVVCLLAKDWNIIDSPFK